jgi:hypothetical protein
LLGLLMIALTAGLGISIRSSAIAQSTSDTTIALARTDDLLRRQIEHALRFHSVAGSAVSETFQGDPDRLRFMVAAPSYPTQAGLYWVTFEVEPRPGGEMLRYRRALYDGDDANAEDTAVSGEAVLLDLPAKFSFAYFDGRSWFDTWHGHEVLPLLVRLRITQEGAQSLLWPEIAARPSIEADPFCPDPSKAAICAGGS